MRDLSRFPFSLHLPSSLSQPFSLFFFFFFFLLQLDENALLEQLADHERALLFGTQAGKFLLGLSRLERLKRED